MPREPSMAEPTVETDLARLRRRVAVPEVFTEGAYVVLPRGQQTSLDLGPTDYQLFLWLPIDDGAWPGIEAALGEGEAGADRGIEAVLGPPGTPATRTVPAAAARALLPAGLVDRAGDGDQDIAGTEQSIEPFTNIFWREGWALRVRGGLLVSLFSS